MGDSHNSIQAFHYVQPLSLHTDTVIFRGQTVDMVYSKCYMFYFSRVCYINILNCNIEQHIKDGKDVLLSHTPNRCGEMCCFIGPAMVVQRPWSKLGVALFCSQWPNHPLWPHGWNVTNIFHNFIINNVLVFCGDKKTVFLHQTF